MHRMAYYMHYSRQCYLETGSDTYTERIEVRWYIEEVTDRIAARLDPRTREAILSIKYDLGTQSEVKGVEIYNAVLEHGIHNCPDFVQWRKKNPVSGILEWMP